MIKATATSPPLRLTGAFNRGMLGSAPGPYGQGSSCVVLARSPEALEGLVRRGWTALGPGDRLPEARPWTDDYVNVLAPLVERWREKRR